MFAPLTLSPSGPGGMNIERYAFGKITVEGQTYTKDVIICPRKVESPWWRREGHRLAVSDLDAILQACPAVLVVGTGYFGRMRVPQETLDFLESRGIRVHVAETNDAVALFNRLQEECADTVAALHLTC